MAGRKNWPWTAEQRRTLKQIRRWRRESKQTKDKKRHRVKWVEIARRLNDLGWLGPGGKWTGLSVARQTNKKPKGKAKKRVARGRLESHEYLTYSEIVKCQRASSAWDRLIFDFLMLTGLRPGCEFEHLEIRDLRSAGEKPEICVRHGKGDKKRFVTISRRLCERLMERCGSRPDDRPIFLTSRGRRLTADALRKRLHKLGLRAGVGRLYPYRLRHTFGCILYDYKKDLKNVADQMGHKDINTTTIYAEVWENAAFEQAEGIDARLAKNELSGQLENPSQIPPNEQVKAI